MSKPLIKEFGNALHTVIGWDNDKQPNWMFEVPSDPSHGDLTISIALKLFKELHGKFASPRDLAQKIADEFEKNKNIKEFYSKVIIEGPGFINFWFSNNYLLANLQKIITKEDSYGRAHLPSGKKIMVEFTDLNPFKEFHIGHLYSNTVGEAVSRLLESQGAEVRRVCYQGDVGMHVAKAVWGMKKKIDDLQLTIDELEKKSLEERAKFLGESYALGATKFEEDENVKQEIINLNQKIFERSDPEINELYDKGKAWSLEHFDTIYKRLGTKFNKFYFESEAGKVGLELVKEFKDKNVFEESDGAVIFPGKKYGLHNRVFINSAGLPTYEAKEIGLAPTKYQDYPYDQSIIITGNEVNEYFKVVLKALSLIRPDLAEKTLHISHGMVRLPEGKMSSRTGNVLTAEWMLDTAREKITQKYPDIAPDIAEKVAVGAVKYALLRSSIGKNIEFSFDESISLEGNSGPYLQYAYARTQSVLSKSKRSHSSFLEDSKIKSQKSKLSFDPEFKTEGQLKIQKFETEELGILRSLIHYPEVIEEASEKFAPNLVCNYLFDLAQKFNLFYQKHKIIDSEQEAFRLSLTQAVAQTLSNALTHLAIPVVEKM